MSESKGPTHTEYWCKYEPPKLKAGQCKDRKYNGHKQKESSSEKADDKDDYFYLEASIEKKFCFDCEQRRWICRSLGCRDMFESLLRGRREMRTRVILAEGYSLRKKNAKCILAHDVELAS